MVSPFPLTLNADLLFASENLDSGRMEELLNRGADPNVRSTQGQTPLHLICKRGLVPAVEYLLLHGADINAQDHQGSTPLMIASGFGRSIIVSSLLDLQPDLNLRDMNGRAALDRAIMSSSDGNISTTSHIISLRLIEAGCEVNYKDAQGWTPLLRACHGGMESVIKALLEKGANPKDSRTMTADPTGLSRYKEETLLTPMSAIWYTVKNDAIKRDALQLVLLAYGSEGYRLSKSLDGTTMLKAAALTGLSKRAVELIEQGHSVQPTKRHKNAVDVARDCGNTDTAAAMSSALAMRAINEIAPTPTQGSVLRSTP